jgi:large repetitive protein
VTLSAVSGQTVNVSYTTILDTASAPEDYRQTQGTLTFSPGQKTKTVPVPVVGDLSHEDTETFEFLLHEESNATRADGRGAGTILDNDRIPTISITDAKILEGDSGETVLRASVKLSVPSSDQITVGYQTVSGTATNNNVDFGQVSGGLMFNPGTQIRSIDIKIIGDQLHEANETFFIKLVDPMYATIADGQGAFIIIDNDPPPTLSISNVSVRETNSGAINAVFTVKLSEISGRGVKVNYTTANGTATADSDYTSKFGTLPILAGRATGVITVPIQGDALVEANETFFVNLTAPVNASITDAQGIGTIVNND